MAFPTYVGKGTFQSTTAATTATPSLPASIQTGDLLIAVVAGVNDNTLISTDGDWTLLTNTGTGTVGNAGAVDVWVWYARYNGVALGAFSTSGLRLKTNQVYAFRNAKTPTVSATGVQATAATAWTLPSITTPSADNFVFFAIGNDRDANSTTNVSGYTNSNLANITEIHDETVNTGAGTGLATVYAEKATAGSTGTTSATSAASNTAAFITFAIEPTTAYTITADGATYSYSGTSANTLFNRKIVADTGTYSYTGGAANLLDNKLVTADVGTFSYTGTDATVKVARILTADSSTYSYTGTDASVYNNKLIAAELATLTYTGSDAGLLYNRTVAGDTGVYSYSGTDATLTKTGITSLTITADAGSFTYTGTDVGLFVSRSIVADSGTYSYSGSDAGLASARTLAAGEGTYSYTGTDASVLYNRKIASDAGTYTYTGTDAGFLYNRVLPTDGAIYSYSGTNVALVIGKKLIADTGSFSYSGGTVDLTFESGIRKIYLGTSKINNLKLGSFQIYEAYLGTSQIWGTARPLNTIIAETRAYTYSGSDATIFRGRKLTANGTTYTITGTANALKYSRRMIADAATYTITGGAAILGGVILNGFTYTDDVVGTGTVEASLELLSNGTGSYSTGAAPSWFSPTTTNIGSSYWAELVAVSGTGTMSGSALSTRIQISGNPKWILTRSTLGVSSRTFTLNIYNASTGGTLMSSGTLTLTAESS